MSMFNDISDDVATFPPDIHCTIRVTCDQVAFLSVKHGRHHSGS